MVSIVQAERDLRTGTETSGGLTVACFARIEDPEGEGSRTFIRLFKTQALAVASATDAMRAAGLPPGPLAGIPISVKDLFDIKGVTTLAGSKALADNPPASRDAPVVARLRAAGAVIVGTTNMTEFAFGGLGLNPHYGTPLNAWERDVGRIPGGSSSGAAVSVTDGMAIAAIGTDTAGSVRIPAALCGIVGFKPTARRVSCEGMVPLATTLDSVGPLAWTVDCCARLDGILAGEQAAQLPPVPISSLRLGIPKTLVFDGIDHRVAESFSRAVSWLTEAGCQVTEIALPEIGELPHINSRGGFAVAEAHAWHHALLERKSHLYDPVIAKRLATGAAITAREYIELLRIRANLINQADAASRPFDGLILPTIAVVAPRVSDLATDSAWLDANRLLIRNTSIANFLDRCAITLPCHLPDAPPVGLMIIGETMGDRRLLAVARTVEAVIEKQRHDR